MSAVAPRTPARAHGELTSVLARVRRRYSYLVWPYDSQMALVPCETLSKAMDEAARARMHGVTAVWIVRSDGQEVQTGCTHCGADEEAFRIVSEPTLHAYWCASCCKDLKAQSHTCRLSRLQQDMLRWLGEDTAKAPGVTTSSHAALVKALDADKGNISKSLRNVASKHFIDIRYSPGGKAVTIVKRPPPTRSPHRYQSRVRGPTASVLSIPCGMSGLGMARQRREGGLQGSTQPRHISPLPDLDDAHPLPHSVQWVQTTVFDQFLPGNL